MVLKECVVCGEEFDAQGKTIVCSDECKKQRKHQKQKEWYQNNREQILQKDKERYQNNREQILQRNKECYRNNREQRLQYHKEYRENNREQILQQKKEYRENNREQIRQYNKERYQNNREKILQQKKEYYLKVLKENPELTPENRWNWGFSLKVGENTKNHTYNGTHHTHHILPVILYPDQALEEWNGAVLPEEWHHEFHSTHNLTYSKDWLCDWSGELFDFIEMKIHESNQDLVLLDKWIETPIEGGV